MRPSRPVSLFASLPLLFASVSASGQTSSPARPDGIAPAPSVEPAPAPATTSPKPESDKAGYVPSEQAQAAGQGPRAPQGVPDAANVSKPAPAGHTGTFEFGSYGRVALGSDLRGGLARPANIVAFGPRWDLESYAEFELRREDKFSEDLKTRVVFTMALLPPFFHFDGKPLDDLAVRNLYAQGTYKWLTLWGGSRMYRGDDIYLLNWWPLDNQNTVGGGAFAALPEDWTLALHAGSTRQDSPYQFQLVPGVAPYGFGTVSAPFLDRPRAVETFKVTKLFRNSGTKKHFQSDTMGVKLIAYAEAHQISEGTRRDRDPNVDITLPADSGFLVGGQATLWTGQRDTYVSLFGRYARGLAAYDPFNTPVGGVNGATTQDASDTHFAFAGNFEKDWFGILWGTYIRFFRGGTASITQPADFDEGTVNVRPQVYFGEYFGLAVDASYQARRFPIPGRGGEDFVNAQLVRTAVFPYFSPWGRGSFKRPQLGLLGGVTFRNDEARSLYIADDPFSRRSTDFYAGFLVEWWFNSTSYP